MRNNPSWQTKCIHEFLMGSTTVAPKAKKFRGEIFLNRDRCKGCGFCIEFCPPKVLAFSEEYNSHGYHPPALLNEAGCTGCDLCGLYCPDFAIYGIRIPVEPTPAQPAGTGG